MSERRIINRTYICHLCGTMHRGPAYYVPGTPTAPQCCGPAMRMLSYEATVVANRMSETERVVWLKSGGRFIRAGGRRRWKRAGRRSSPLTTHRSRSGPPLAVRDQRDRARPSRELSGTRGRPIVFRAILLIRMHRCNKLKANSARG